MDELFDGKGNGWMAAPKVLQPTVVSGVVEESVQGPILFNIISNDTVGLSVLSAYLQMTPS